jgi:SAM-dependent methyltransferase
MSGSAGDRQRETGPGGAARRWAEQLAALRIPDEILAAAPESPWTFDVGLFSRIADEGDRGTGPSASRAVEALPPGGCVMDVGCGAGAGSLPLVPPAGRLVGVDPSAGMLAAFAERADARGVNHTEIEGSWPDVAAEAPWADVVISHNVLYGVPDVVPFAWALGDRARRRVVIEITAAHPLVWTAPYWLAVYGIARPSGPLAEDVAAALVEAGLDVVLEHSERPVATGRGPDELVPFLRRRLCLTADRDAELRALVLEHGRPEVRRVATLWWDT